jgi:RNA polymerase sigma factor (sigma-70 family)
MRRYEPLVQRIAWELRPPPHITREDLAQEARLGLLAALRAWRAARGPFSPFAERCASNQALATVQAGFRPRQELLNRALSLSDTYGRAGTARSDRPPLMIIDSVADSSDGPTDPHSHLLAREELICMARAAAVLTGAERTALAGEIAGRSYGQLGADLGRSAKGASQVVYRARRKLAAALERHA